MKFSYFTSVKSASGIECTPEVLLSATHDPNLMSTCSAIAYCTDADQRGKLKKRLPIVTWQAYFPNGSRKNAEAVPSGLFMLDIDHVDEPNQVYLNKVAGRIDELGIMVVHKTPSTKGLRIVALCRPEFKTIAENQQWMAAQLGLAEYDEACNDLARASYLVPEQYFYYRDGKIFTMPMPEGVNIVAGKGLRTTEAVPRLQDNETTSRAVAGSQLEPQASTIQENYKGIALSDIANKWLEQHGGTPGVGERNTVLYQLATRMRYITDFNPQAIFDAIPHCNLPADEVMALCQSACGGVRGGKIPWDLRAAIEALQTKEQEQEDKETVNLAFVQKLPPLPFGLRHSTEGQPTKAVMPVLCGIMPLCMAYATHITYNYCDGGTHRLNAMAVIYGPQGSGKSLVKDEIDIWKKPMQMADKGAREDEATYKEMRKKRKANETLPPEPKAIIRYVPLTVSCSGLLKRLINADGIHLFSFGEELDTLHKTNKAGTWSEKTDCYRLAFDNGEWGQDYVSESSVSGLVRVYYNFTVLGTPGSVYKCFPAVDSENGMCSRLLFAEMTHNPYEHMVKKQKVDMAEKTSAILHAVDVLEKSKGHLELPRLAEHMEAWCNACADEARLFDDRVIDTFRKRAAIIGFRCGVIYYLLENTESQNEKPVETDNLLQFATTMADYCLHHQCKLFGEELLKQQNQEKLRGYTPHTKANFFDLLSDEFTFEQLQSIRPNAKYMALRAMIFRWKSSNMIEEMGKNLWRKLA